MRLAMARVATGITLFLFLTACDASLRVLSPLDPHLCDGGDGSVCDGAGQRCSDLTIAVCRTLMAGEAHRAVGQRLLTPSGSEVSWNLTLATAGGAACSQALLGSIDLDLEAVAPACDATAADHDSSNNHDEFNSTSSIVNNAADIELAKVWKKMGQHQAPCCISHPTA